jgi:hypothetical protein
MSKDNIPPYIGPFRYSVVSELLILSLGCLATQGCASTATEMKVKVCTAERGKPLPPECFSSKSQYGEGVPVYPLR